MNTMTSTNVTLFVALRLAKQNKNNWYEEGVDEQLLTHILKLNIGVHKDANWQLDRG